jgi:DNA-directed RNA polymerase specialized sigma24 family protein
MKRMKLALPDGATVLVTHSWRDTVTSKIGADPKARLRQSQPPADLSTRIADALRRLPTEHRVTLQLAYHFKCSREDIARVLNCSVETVMTRMSDAAKALRHIVR